MVAIVSVAISVTKQWKLKVNFVEILAIEIATEVNDNGNIWSQLVTELDFGH